MSILLNQVWQWLAQHNLTLEMGTRPTGYAYASIFDRKTGALVLRRMGKDADLAYQAAAKAYKEKQCST